MESTDEAVGLLREIRDGQRELLSIQQANATRYEQQSRLYRRVQAIALVALAIVILGVVMPLFSR